MRGERVRSTFEKRGETFWRGGKLRGIQTERATPRSALLPHFREARDKSSRGVGLRTGSRESNTSGLKKKKGKECR